MRLDFNRVLKEFFEKAAQKESAESWFASHPFMTAVDDEENTWKDI